jgi:hypothetical protein
MFEKSKDYPFFRLECFEHAKKKSFVSNFEHVNLSINGIIKDKNDDNPNYYCDFSNIQKCNFKKCPFTWVSSFDYFLPSMVFARMVRMFLHGDMKFGIPTHHLFTKPR